MTLNSSLPMPFGIASILSAQAEHRGDAIALEYTDGQLSYAELWSLVKETVAAIQYSFPPVLGKRQRIGIVHDNGPGMAINLLGICSAATALPFNPMYSTTELQSYFMLARLDGLVLPESGYKDVEVLANELAIPVLRTAWNKPLRHISLTKLENIEMPSKNDLAIVMLTSGSTGKSKMVPLTHQNICVAASEVCKSLELSEEDRCLCMWEQYHIGGLVDLLLAPLMSGGTVIVTSGFSVDNFFHILEASKPTWFQGVPTTLGALISHIKRYDITLPNTSLRFLRSVAAPLSAKLQDEIEQLFAVPVIQTFGMTEAGPLITSTLLPPYQRKLGSVGRPCGTTIAIYSPDGTLLDTGKEGEVAIRGENVFSGYEYDDKTTHSLFRDGWFFTGDIGYVDKEGDLFLTGRIKQFINRGGEKINPQEVDNQLLMHPDILEAACFSVPHPTLGEDIMAAIVFEKGKFSEAETIRTYLGQKIASFKIPSKIIIVNKIPRNSIGKIDRIACSKLVQQKNIQTHSESLPQTTVEKVLMKIWATELDLDSIGVKDNFFELGGDSLSSARIVLAVEKYFKLKIPDKDVLTLTSVSHMAKYIENNLTSTTNNTEKINLTKESIYKLMMLTEIKSRENKKCHSEILHELTSAASLVEFKLLCDAFSNYQTPKEIIQLVQHYRNHSPQQSSYKASTQAYENQLHIKNWIRTLQADLDLYSQSRDWHRINLNDNIILYQSSKGIVSKKLIIGLAGLAGKLLAPTYIILGAIDTSDFDLMLVRDPDRNHYRNGVTDLASSLDELALKLKDLAVKSGYTQYTTFGTSAGGLPAIRTGQIINAKQILAVNPDNIERHPSTAKQLSLSEKQSPQLVKVCISAENIRDSIAGNKLKEIIPHVDVIPYPGIQSHNLIYILHQKRKLESFLAEHLTSNNIYKSKVAPRSISIHSKLAELYKYRPPYMDIFFQTAINKLNISKQSTLLDLCCGRGELASRFSPFPDKIFAIDGSAEMLKNKIEKKNITYFQSDINAETISLPDKADTIVVGSAMHWLEKNSLQSMINTNLKKNGKFFAAHTYLELSNEPYYQQLKNLNIQYGLTAKFSQKKQTDFYGKEKMYHCGFETIDNIRATSTVTFDLEWFFYNRLTYLYQDKFRKNVMANLEAYKTDFFEALSPFLENGKLKAKLLNTGIIYGQKT